ncbi:MAG: DUF2238 domain-containing protein [Oceanospirillaceae bacterium]|uniref:DUF2238 domain-containing protein n=1 Tax=Marinobacterium litorale TaxID=404770 RepID=UPI0004133A1A|nr:DUF2238 domain-containing protein [Marinobacterium litorale]MBT00082.1 DUF2238 domain-containing protein [Oceanospirillaceae bacterium]
MPRLWILIFTLVLLWSGWQPKDYMTWGLEVAPAVIALGLLLATFKRFPLTPLCLWLILVHAVILMVGGHYTYAEVPLFDSIAHWLGQSRNNYDKLGHLAQGFIPAIVAREIIIRRQLANGRFWIHLFTLSICLAFSAFYELIEWWVALLSGESAEAFLGTQGYVWDTQSDMAMALLGALLALVTLHGYHDRQIRRLIQSDLSSREPGEP